VSEEKELPRGWTNGKLEDFCTIIMGQSPPSSEYNENGEGLPFFQGKAEFTDLFPKVRKWCTAPTKIAEAEDILLSVRAPVGPTNLAPSLCCVGRGLAAIRPAKNIQVRYVLYAIRAYNSSLTELGTGTTFAAISGDDVRAFEIPLAPSPEQIRIVSAIEQQFSRLDAGVAALQRAKAKLKRYRAAVLKAAVEGKLTETWRAEHPTIEPASQLLERILKERRAKWEADLRAKGKDPAKVKYVEPIAPDVEGLPELPEGWCWATPKQLASTNKYSLAIGPFGSNLKVEDYQERGVPLVFVRNIRSTIFDGPDTRYVTVSKADELRAHRVFGGDILITKMGDPPGDACLYPETSSPAIITADCIKWTLSPLLPQRRFFVNAANSSIVRTQILGITRGVAQLKVSLGRFEGIAFPLPPLNEQDQIVSEVERHISLITQLEIAIEANLKRAERLRQSILHEAFAGRLVLQDPTDEPASVLLERIRNGRNNQKNNIEASTKKIRSVKLPESVAIDVINAEQTELWESVGN